MTLVVATFVLTRKKVSVKNVTAHPEVDILSALEDNNAYSANSNSDVPAPSHGNERPPSNESQYVEHDYDSLYEEQVNVGSANTFSSNKKLEYENITDPLAPAHQSQQDEGEMKNRDSYINVPSITVGPNQCYGHSTTPSPHHQLYSTPVPKNEREKESSPSLEDALGYVNVNVWMPI